MKCLSLNSDIDVCVSVDVKLIYKKPGSGDLDDELRRIDDRSRAKHLGTGFEARIAQTIADELAGRD